MQPDPDDIVPLFLDAVERHRPPTPAVVVEYPVRCIVHGDRTLLDALLARLVSNAIRFSSERAEIRVVLGCRPGCSFYVRDNGCGFSAARAATICRPEPPGTGADAGLSGLAWQLGRQGGRLWAESEPGWGATFFVSLSAAGPAAAGSAG